MNNNTVPDHSKHGMIGGTLLSLLSSLPGYADVLRTIITAATGALVSFTVSWLLQWLLRKRR